MLPLSFCFQFISVVYQSPTAGEGREQKAAKEIPIEETQVELSMYIVTEAEHS